MTFRRFYPGLVASGALFISTHSVADEPTELAQHVRSLLNAKCTSCHGGVKHAGGLSFLSRSGILTKGKSGEIAVKPGEPNSSELIRRVTSEDKEIRMPPPERGPA